MKIISYGYRIRNGRVEPDPESRAAAREIYAQFLTNNTLGEGGKNDIHTLRISNEER
jgi:hypothetical protein